MSSPMNLTALDGSNPLCFLAALGTLRLATVKWPTLTITLRWQKAGAWSAVLEGAPVGSAEEFVRLLREAPLAPVEQFKTLGKNITVSPEKFADFAGAAKRTVKMDDRTAADFCASFGCEAVANDKGDRVQYTQLCFITGSGHQDFLGTLIELHKNVTAEQLHRALFERIDDPDRGLSFRWNPMDAKEYSLLWENPSKTGVFSTWGANFLAFEALPLYPCMPNEHRLETTGFHRPAKRRGDSPAWPRFTWPIWETPLVLDEVRSLISLSELHQDDDATGDWKGKRRILAARGVARCFRSLRVRIPPGGAQFKVSFRPAQAV